MSSKTPDEEPKKKVAKRVIASKRRYFASQLSVSVEAETLEEAIKKAKAGEITQEDSDA